MALMWGLMLLLSVVCGAPFAVVSAHADTQARIIAFDTIALPNQDVYLEASLYRGGIRGYLFPALGGEVLKFSGKDGTLLGEKLTDVGGTARIVHRASKPGAYPFKVALDENPRYEAQAAEASLFVRDPRRCLFFVVAEETLAGLGSAEFLLRSPEKIVPAPDSVAVLNRLHPHFDIVYLTALPRSSLDKMRKWLLTDKYPAAPLMPAGGSLWKDGGEDPRRMVAAIDLLWKDRANPAYIVVGKKSLATELSQKKVRVLLLEPRHTDGPSEKKEGKRCTWKEFCQTQGWKEIETCVRPGKDTER